MIFPPQQEQGPGPPVNPTGTGLLIAASLLAAILAKWSAENFLGVRVPFLLFTFPVVVAAARAGLTGGIVTTAASALIASLLFQATAGTAQITNRRILLFVVLGASISLVGHRLRRSHARLAESEERYRFLVDGISDYAIFSLDPGGLVTSWNPGAERIKGYRSDEIIGRSFELFYTEEDRQAGLPAQILKRAAENNHISVEGWRVRKDGSRFWAEIAVSAIRDNRGAIRSFAKITRDVSARRAQQTELADSEARNRALLDAGTEAIVCVNPAGTIVTTNRMTERMFGYLESELNGQPLAVLLPEDAHERHAAHVSVFFSQSGTRSMGRERKLYGRKKDGTEFPVEITLTSIQNSEGPQAVAFITDVTARRHWEEALRESEERFRNTFENAAVGMAHVGVDGKWLRVNPRLCEILGYSQDELLERTFQQITHSDDLPADLEQIRELLAENASSHAIEKRYFRKDGSEVWVHRTVSLVRSEAGRPLHFIVAVEDIGARKRVEAALDRRIRQQEAVADLGLTALTGTPLQLLFDQAVEALSRQLEVQFAEVVELLGDDRQLIVRSCIGWRPEKGAGFVFPVARSQAGYAIRTGLPVIAEDIHAETRFEVPENLLEHGIISGASVIIQGKGGEPFGVLGAHSRERRRFTTEDIHFMRGIANVLASAIEAASVVNEREELLARATAAEREATTILESISDAFCAYDANWRLTYANSAAEELLAAGRQELVGQNLLDVYPAFAGKQLQNEYLWAAQQRLPIILDARDPASGHWLEVRVYPASGGGISVYFRDITDRKLAEQRLREGEELFRTLANSIPQMAWMADETGSVFWYNDRWFQYTGTTLEQLRGEGWRTVHHPDFVEAVAARLQYSFETGTKWEDTFPIRGSDGQYRWFLSRALPVRDEAGRVKRWFGTSTDITRQMEAERAIRDSRERLRAAVEASGTGTFRWDLHTGAVTWDEELDRMFGLPPGETVQTVEDFLARVHFADRPAVVAAVKRCLSEGANFEMEFRVAGTEAPERWVYDRGRVFFDSEDRPSYVTGGCLDITARKRVEAMLRRSNEDLRQFAWAASHDLQEPLRMVTAYTQLLERRYADKLDADGRQFIAYAVEAAERMENLLRSMRAYWQASADAEQPVLVPVDTEAAFESALHNLATTIAETNAQITHDRLPVIQAQEVHAVQLFQNLIGNALKYCSPGVTPQIHIWAEREEGKWVFSVRDNGIGIAPRYANQIFGIFQRLHTQKVYKGTGIGLAICQKIVECHGGRIWVESEGEGCGSTFRFILPAQRPPLNDWQENVWARVPAHAVIRD